MRWCASTRQECKSRNPVRVLLAADLRAPPTSSPQSLRFSSQRCACAWEPLFPRRIWKMSHARLSVDCPRPRPAEHLWPPECLPTSSLKPRAVWLSLRRLVSLPSRLVPQRVLRQGQGIDLLRRAEGYFVSSASSLARKYMQKGTCYSRGLNFRGLNFRERFKRTRIDFGVTWAYAFRQLKKKPRGFLWLRRKLKSVRIRVAIVRPDRKSVVAERIARVQPTAIHRLQL